MDFVITMFLGLVDCLTYKNTGPLQRPRTALSVRANIKGSFNPFLRTGGFQ